MKYLVEPLSDENLEITPNGVCAKLECVAVACGDLGCGRYCDCYGAVAEPWRNGESLF